MKKQIKIMAIAAGALVLAIGTTSCEKSMDSDSVEVYEDVVSSELDVADVQSDETVGAHEMNCSSTPFKHDLPSCATVTKSGEDFPKTITIDFGDGCEDNKGRIKRGKVIIVETGAMKEEGSTRTITFEAFYVGEVNITGTRTVTNIGTNDAGNRVHRIEGEITGKKGDKSRKRVFTRTREQIAGAETCDRSDDEFLITGKATITAGPRTITREITTPLHVAPGTCKYPTSGKIFVDRGKRSGEIDFGNGTCDNIAVLTTEKGHVKEINLDERKCKK